MHNKEDDGKEDGGTDLEHGAASNEHHQSTKSNFPRHFAELVKVVLRLKANVDKGIACVELAGAVELIPIPGKESVDE